MSNTSEPPIDPEQPSFEWTRSRRILAALSAASLFVGVCVATYKVSEHQAALRSNSTPELIKRLNKATGGKPILKYVGDDYTPPSIEVMLPNCNDGSTISEDEHGNMFVADANGQTYLFAKDHSGIKKPATPDETALNVARAICGQFVEAPIIS